jgi:hypothetical protein
MLCRNLLSNVIRNGVCMCVIGYPDTLDRQRKVLDTSLKYQSESVMFIACSSILSRGIAWLSSIIVVMLVSKNVVLVNLYVHGGNYQVLRHHCVAAWCNSL